MWAAFTKEFSVYQINQLFKIISESGVSKLGNTDFSSHKHTWSFAPPYV